MPFEPDYFVPEDRRAYSIDVGPVGVLMLHGFMGSPTSSMPLAGYLAERGISMRCPLLPGHGELPNKLYQVPYQRWIDEAEEGLAILRQRCDEIFLMGHSMGTVLSAYLIKKYPDIRGIIMLAPLYDVPSRAINLTRFLRHIVPWFYPLRFKRMEKLVRERILDFDPTFDFDDPAAQARLPEMTRVPTSGIDEMRKMADIGKKLWEQIDVPALIFQGGKDIAVSAGNAQQIYDLLPNGDKKLHFFPRAGHELMRPFEPVHKEVWTAVYDFIQLRSSLAGVSERNAAAQEV
ncbi:MAG: alpha/beta fold hydrolase [Candidatus Promineifilaceae bacterium]